MLASLAGRIYQDAPQQNAFPLAIATAMHASKAEVMTAFAVAPIAAVVAFWALNFWGALFQGSLPGGVEGIPASLFLFLMFGLPLSYLATLGLACPAYLLLKRWGRLTQRTVLVTAGSLGALIIGTPSILDVWQNGFDAWRLLIGLGFGGVSGLAAGLVFLAVARPAVARRDS